ncbi:MAG: polyhydroxyalkanoate synthesis repressor PhaR, partial [Alphaproteobacteria bacterium]|nr:polyhydroxyalkanoate synthesis repressor PhaR [Alphaproteobacteria bacterium]
NQDQMRSHLQDAFDGLFPFGSLEEMSKQNVALMEQAMQMFVPFANEPKDGGTQEKPARPAKPATGESAPRSGMSAPSTTDTQLDALMRKIEDLQEQVENLSGKKEPR